MKLVTVDPTALLHGSPPLALPGASGRRALLEGDAVIFLDVALAFYEARHGRGAGKGDVIERYGTTMVDLVDRWAIVEEALEELRQVHARGDLPLSWKGDPLFAALADVHLVSPLLPGAMRDGYAFRQHVETARRNRGLEMIPEFDQFPVFYFTNHRSVTGPGTLSVMPLQAERLDYELEAAVVVGRGGVNLDVAAADDAIFGLLILNDFSARAMQMEEMKLSLGPAKGKDFATGLGPWLVTKDELLPRAKATDRGLVFDLEMRAYLNGELLSRGNLRDMTFTFSELLVRASYGAALFPGDVIGSGTCGTGCLLELNGSKVTQDRWLREGDEIALEVDGLGRLENRIAVRAS